MSTFIPSSPLLVALASLAAGCITEAAVVERSADAISAEMVETHRQLAALTAEVEELRRRLGEPDPDSDSSLSSRLAALEDQNPGERLAAIEQGQAEHQGWLTAIADEVTRLDGRLDGHDGTLASHAAALADQAGLIGTHRELLETHDAALSDHAAALIARRAEIASLEIASASYASTLTEHGSRLSAAEAWISDLDARVETAEATFEGLDDAIASLEDFEALVRTPTIFSAISGPIGSWSRTSTQALYCSMVSEAVHIAPNYAQAQCTLTRNAETGTWTLSAWRNNNHIWRTCRMVCFGVES